MKSSDPQFGSLSDLLRAKSRARRSAVIEGRGRSPTIVSRNDLSPTLALTMRAPNSLSYPRDNVRGIDPAQVARVERSIMTFGNVAPVLIDQNDCVVEGVIRVEAAKSLGLNEISCIQIGHLSPAQAKQLRVTMNRLQERGSWDLTALHGVLVEVNAADFDLSITGFEPRELDLILQDEDGEEFAEASREPDRSRPAVVKPGDVVRLGPHTVICGDARDASVLTAIMGEPARIVFTDQPYNVRISGHVTRGAHREFAMASGEMSANEFLQFNRQWIARASEHLVDGGILATFIDWGGLGSVYAAATECGLTQLNLVVWTKTNAGMGSLYRSQHELLPLFKKGRQRHINNVKLGKGGRWRSNVWQYAGASSPGSDSRNGLKDHPTVKPVAMLEDALLDLTNRGDIVLDPFLGSGSTLLAAHRCGRLCRGVEIDPHYVDVIVQRFEAATGQRAVIESPVAVTAE